MREDLTHYEMYAHYGLRQVFPPDEPNGKFIPREHHYNANNKRKKGKRK